MLGIEVNEVALLDTIKIAFCCTVATFYIYIQNAMNIKFETLSP